MSIPTGTNTSTPDPLRHIYGYVAWSGWWHFPVVLFVATTASVVAAVLLAGVGPEEPGFLPASTSTAPAGGSNPPVP